MRADSRTDRGPGAGGGDRWLRLAAWGLVNAVVLAVGVALVRQGRTPDEPTPVRYLQPPAATPFHASTPGPADVDGPRRPALREGAVVAPTGPRGCRLTLQRDHLVVPDLCISAPLVTTSRTSEGALVIPDSATDVGLWGDGAPLSARAGSTLLAGHVTYGRQGPGSLFELAKVTSHQLVYTVDGSGGVQTWRVSDLQQVTKQRLPEWVFAGRGGSRRLVIVTCGGPVMDIPGHGPTHRDNVVVSATPA